MALAMRPERVVLVCVDGGRQDWFEKYATPNINRLISEGVGFRNAVVGHALTETACGLATVSTGADIRYHRIIASHECMTLKKKEPYTALTTEVGLLSRQRDVAPTIEEVLILPVPSGVSGRILPVLSGP